MKAKLVSGVKKAAAIAAGAMFLGATMGAATVFGTTLNQLPGPFVSSGAVHAVVVVGAAAASQDVLGSVDLAAALAANAASTHVSQSSGGSVWLGNLVHQGGSQASNDLAANGTVWLNSPASVNIMSKNFTTAAKNNFTADMNLTFASAPKFNELNVVLPAGSWELQSYVVNRSGGSRTVLNALTDGMRYLLGSPDTLYNLTANTATNVSFAASSTTPNVHHATANATWFLVPKTLTVGVDTVAVDGVATVYTSNGNFNQVQIAVNSGTATYYNMSTTNTVDGVTFTLGPSYITNATGKSYVSSITASSYGLTQNISAGHNAALSNFGLPSFNVTAGSNTINLAPTFSKTLTGSLSSSSSFMAAGMINVTLGKLTRAVGTAGDNLTVVTATAGKDVLRPVNASTAHTVEFNITTGLKSVVLGTDYRGAFNNATYNWTNGPDGTLEPFQQKYEAGVGWINASSEYVFPQPTSVPGAVTTYATITQKTGSSQFTFTDNSTHGGSTRSVTVLFDLPNGREVGLALKPTGTNYYTYNVTKVLNYTSPGNVGSLLSPNGTYRFGGYNVTLGNVKINSVGLVEVNISGPSVSFYNGASTYSLVPGYNSIYAANGTLYSTVALANGLGTAAFSSNKLTVTDPMGGSVDVPVAENDSTFATYFPTNVTASADTWGTYLNTHTTPTTKINGTSKWGSGTYEVNVPSQNYTLTVGGAEVVSGATKYNLTKGTVINGQIVNVSGVSSSFSASSLFGTNVFPLGELDNAFTGATNNVPVLVVGGAAVNTLAQQLLNQTGPVYGNNFTKLTGVKDNESLVWMFNNVSAFGHEPALWVAGWSGSDTLLASEVVSESLLGTPVVALNGTKVILSTGSGVLSSVSVVSSS